MAGLDHVLYNHGNYLTLSLYHLMAFSEQISLITFLRA